MKRVVWGVLLLAAILYLFDHYRLYRLEGTSMNYGLLEGDRVLCDRRFEKIERGDLLVADHADEHFKGLFIKRCAALPGDRFFQRERSFYLQIDGDSLKTQKLGSRYDLELVSTKEGWFIKDPYLKYYGVVHNWRLEGPEVLTTIPLTTVEPDHYYLLGDYRDNSEDSRFFGAIPRERIYSKVIYILKKPQGWLDLLTIKEAD
jgi:signal peptidase I